MPTVAALIVERLREAGVRTLFGVPGGGSSLDVVEAGARADLPFVLTATETSGAIAALAQAEISGSVGGCLTTLGPGVSSVVNGVACAKLDRAPLVVLTDSYPAASRGRFEHQRLGHRALLAPVVKWSVTLSPESAEADLQEALRVAIDPPPGPVHVDTAGDVATVESDTVESPTVESRKSKVTSRSPVESRQSQVAIRESSREAIVRALASVRPLIAGARKPIFLVGLGARRGDDAASLRSFCERRSIPAMVTYKAKGVIPDDHPCFAGVFTNGSIERAILNGADLLVGVGLDPVELLPRPWTYRQPIVYAGPWPVEDRHVPFAAQLVGDVGEALAAMDSALPSASWDLDEVHASVDAQHVRISAVAAGLAPHQVVTAAAARLPRRSRITVDAGAHMFPATVLWPAAEPNQLLISNGLSTMGFALPAAIGLALLDRDRPVAALTGDGGLLMCAGDLLTAARERLRIIVLVFSDASLSLIEIKQQQKQYTTAGVELGTVRWPALAESLGVAGFCASSEVELERSLELAIDCDGPALVEARIDPTGYGRILRELRG